MFDCHPQVDFLLLRDTNDNPKRSTKNYPSPKDYHVCDDNFILLLFGGCSDSWLERNRPRAFGIFYMEDDESVTEATKQVGSPHAESIVKISVSGRTNSNSGI